MKIATLTILLLAVFITGCQSIRVTSTSPLVEETSQKKSIEPIVEKYWKLIKLNGQEVKMAENQEREMYFMLTATDNNVKGFGGCNGLSGSYELENENRIKFSQMLTTLRACINPTIRETEFMQVFEIANNYTFKDDTLILNIGKRAPLAVFEAIYFQ
jgi:heat shock protein HslJ